ncbi:MAG: hypothetical protein HKL96_12235 [Phycisphaerales bacterium]|nr:hypothetical protein [Phycisphaerales bacterium]
MLPDRSSIEEYLDGELPLDQIRQFEAMVANNPLAQDLIAQVRKQRHDREQVWRSYEPSEAQTARLVDEFLYKIHTGSNAPAVPADGLIISIKRMRWLKRTAAIAACLAIGASGFALGRLGFTPHAANAMAAPGYTVRVELPNGETVSQNFRSYSDAKKFERYARQYVQETQATPPGGDTSSVSLAQQGEF